jgi:predicted lipoprotein with Yx(FWY)xxD motif
MKAALVIALVLAATAAGLAHAEAAAPPGATVSTAVSKLGPILVDSRGRTLYLFERDRRGRSACAGACTVYWPPLLTRTGPSAGRNAKQSLLGVIRRSDGTRQVTYAGHPLYRFMLDTKPGQTNGQDLHDFGAAWYVVGPTGTKIESDGS